MISTTFQASPSRCIARITQPPGSTSHQRSPCSAERGKAWWLWCHDSPNEGSASQKTFVDWSSVLNRRRPKKWQIELIEKVTWCTRKMRTSPAQNSAVRPPASSPLQAPAGQERDHQPGDHERAEQPVHHAHAAVLEQVGRVLVGVLGRGVVEQPAEVRVPEPAQRPGEAAAVAVRAVRVALVVGVRVVAAVVGHPADHGPLDRHRAAAPRTGTRSACRSGRRGG